MSWQTRLIPILTLGMLSACSTTDVSQYAQQKPVLDMQQYFNGTIDAWGMFQDRSGTVIKRFTVVMQCSWKDGVGTLDEDFTYSDGTKQKRIWTIKRNASGQYIGTADDVVGVAIGNTAGNATGAGIGAARVIAAARCCGLFEIRSFMPLSVEISMESTVEPSSISMSFFT